MNCFTSIVSIIYLLQEKTWSYDIIRRIAPHEIELLKDVSFQFKVRFRLGGDNFPPIAMFKIFIVNQKTSYYSGRNNIIPTNLVCSWYTRSSKLVKENIYLFNITMFFF